MVRPSPNPYSAIHMSDPRPAQKLSPRAPRATEMLPKSNVLRSEPRTRRAPSDDPIHASRNSRPPCSSCKCQRSIITGSNAPGSATPPPAAAKPRYRGAAARMRPRTAASHEKAIDWLSFRTATGTTGRLRSPGSPPISTHQLLLQTSARPIARGNIPQMGSCECDVDIISSNSRVSSLSLWERRPSLTASLVNVSGANMETIAEVVPPAKRRPKESRTKSDGNNGHHTEGSAPSSPEDLALILESLQTMRDGNFSVRLPVAWTGLKGKIADTFNDIIAANERRSEER